jgi:hypothetical protein
LAWLEFIQPLPSSPLEEGQHALLLVVMQIGPQHRRQRQQPHPQQDDEAPAQSGHEQHETAGRGDQDGRAQVGLLGHQAHGDQDQQAHQADIHPARRQGAQVQVSGDGHWHRQFHDLGGLEAQHAEIQPALRALGGIAHHQH